MLVTKGAAGFCAACQGSPVVAQRMAWYSWTLRVAQQTHTRPPVFFAVPKLGAGVCIDLIVALCIVMLRCFNHERAERFGM